MKFNREQRALIFKTISGLIIAGVLIALLISLKQLILPMIVGALLAYLCKPLLGMFKYHWLPEGIRVFGLISFFVGFLFLSIWVVRSSMPDEVKKLELLTRMQYKFNEKIDSYLEVNKPKDERSFVVNLLNDEVMPLVVDVNNYLTLNAAQQGAFIEFYEKKLIEDKYYKYFLKNIDHKEMDEKREISSVAGKDEVKSFTLSRVMNVFSIWIIMPLIFVFLLFDKGDIQRYFVNFIPNRYFELTLTVFEQVNLAIGRYLRGTLIECALVGASIFAGLILIGIEIKAAFLISVIAGLTNAIPFLGTVVGCVVGLAYAMIAEGVTPILPFITADDLMIGIIVTMMIAHFLDNAIFQPVVVGSAVSLHPIVIILGIVGGSLLFGFAGILLAIPTIVVIKVSTETLFKGLKDYYII
ncbi:MAG: AI-2E family transporter [Bdellovibrionota bacterium]